MSTPIAASSPESTSKKTGRKRAAKSQRYDGTDADTPNTDEPSGKRARSGDDGEANAPQRRQPACQMCRTRKVKCDKKRPSCRMCSANNEECEYPDDDDKITLRSATNTILDRFELLSQEFQVMKRQLHGNMAPPSHIISPQQQFATAANKVQQDGKEPTVESSRDFLQIPPHPASADTVLRWPVFENKFPANALIGDLFCAEDNGIPQYHGTAGSQAALVPLEEEKIPLLVDRFLQNVHTKNPILNVEALVKHGRKCAESGVGWDAQSCLVLMACALGSVTKPYGRHPAPEHGAYDDAGRNSTSSSKMFARELEQGDSCFNMACRRLGTLRYSLIGAHCHFFAGVYLMYTLRPLDSWHYFVHASIFFQVHLKMTHGLSGDPEEALSAPLQNFNAPSRKAKRLEQSLYWSCFKSECEFRVELPLLQSEISMGEYPDLFPSPPSPIATEFAEQESAGISRAALEEELELRQHAVRLCNEEESWYYYLTEIALRRIGNRIVNTFFRQEPTSWLANLRPLLYMAREFEAQVSSWSAHLPPAMQQYETNSIIRAPHLSFQNEEDPTHVSRELSWAVDNRLLEMQTWLYQPFLYFYIHAGNPYGTQPVTTPSETVKPRISSLLNPFSPTGNVTSPGISSTTSDIARSTMASMTAEDMSHLNSLVDSGIQCCMKTIEVRARGHRHHGLWFDLRSIMTASLVLVALVKCGHASRIPGGLEGLWGATRNHSSSRPGQQPIGGKIGFVLRQFEFWAGEMPGLWKYKSVLEATVHDVRRSAVRYPVHWP